MYRMLALMKSPLENAGDIENIIKSISEKTGLEYGGLSMGEYGSRKTGFIPIYSMYLHAGDYTFRVSYHEGLNGFQSDKTKNFIRTDYNAKVEITGNEPDPDMEYFNDFILICENIEKSLDCILVEYNRETSLWEKID